MTEEGGLEGRNNRLAGTIGVSQYALLYAVRSFVIRRGWEMSARGGRTL